MRYQNETFITYIKNAKTNFSLKKVRAISNRKAWLQKPFGGLWAVSSRTPMAWRDWAADNMPNDELYQYTDEDAVHFCLPGARIYHLHDDESLMKLVERFGVVSKEYEDAKLIDWTKVAKHYDAVYFHEPDLNRCRARRFFEDTSSPEEIREIIRYRYTCYEYCFDNCDIESICVLNPKKVKLLQD